MDNLYDNLENYEEENIIHELKNENKELKMKIDEYSATINLLQKDFDKLSAEYKKLELNYSSLLKTAKAEIERKTQMITNLNIEKDMLVIQTLQTRGRGFLNSIKNVSSNSGAYKKTEDKGKSRSNSPKPDFKKERKDTHTDRNTDLKSSHNSRNIKTETKENISEEKHSSKSRKIMNRRKSMPAVSKYDGDRRISAWSSEDENDQYAPLRDPRLSNIDGSHKRSKRASETSSTDDKHSYHSQTSRDTGHTRRSARQSDENYRKTSRYDSFHNRKTSPVRNTRKLADANSTQHGHDRQRSPPSDKYRRHKSRDRRSNYERDSRVYDNPSNERSEKQAVKHKMLPHLQTEEPSHKKIRIDSYGEYLSGDRSTSKKECSDPSKALISPDDPYRSCKSPDHFTAEHNDQNLVKEIMHTAATPLEDPRISSKRYVLKTENNKAILKTTSSHDIDIKKVDKSLWGLPIIPVPEALLDKPSSAKMTEELVDEIYMNIDKLDMSLETEEIGGIEDGPVVKSTTDSIKLDDKNKSETVKDMPKNKEPDDKNLELQVFEITQKLPIKQYRIPKKNRHQQLVVESKENLKSQVEKVPPSETDTKKKKEIDKTVFLEMVSENVEPGSEEPLPEVTNSILKSDPSNIIDNGQDNQLSSIGTVERDLLLSDDASDNMDLPKQKITEEHIDDKSKDKCSESKIKDCTLDTGSSRKAKDKTEHTHKEKDDNKVAKSKRESSSTSKAKKSKKKPETKSKEDNKDAVTKRSKSKREKDINIDGIKTKFSDLFGESNSLIMPEDLGIDRPVAATINPNKFESIFDDTQSAVDLQIEQKAIIESIKHVETNCEDNQKDVECSQSDPTNKTLINVDKSKDNIGQEQEKTEEANNDEVNLYQNLNPEVSMDGSNVVIISTGVQPNCTDEKLINSNQNSEINRNLPLKSYTLPVLKALATSTPLKITVETTSLIGDQSAKMAAIQEASNVETSNSNSVEQFNEADVPDVRIFVKRRRKVKKT